MIKNSTWLLDHKKDVYSQSGEDGIIEQILSMLSDKDKWCVEFGAWDGLYLTNTRLLIEYKAYSAVLIEPDVKKFKELKANNQNRASVIPINKFVGFSEQDNLDQILETTPIPINFDLLSIDIDGNDYHVWKAFSTYRPKIVVIEFNPTIPTAIRFVQPADPSINQGASLLSLVELGNEKGYELVSVLTTNAFFVRKEYFSLFQIEVNSPDVLRVDNEYVTYVFSGFDGHMFLYGNCSMPWHGLDLKESAIQQLPLILQKYPCNYSSFHKILFGLFLLFTRPKMLIRLAYKKIFIRKS